jgi:hypothetical protein
VVRQRPAKPRTAVRVRSSPLVPLLLALVVAGCGTPEPDGLDAEQLVPRLDDLPAGFNLVLAESFPIPTSKVLHDSKIFDDPWSASSAELIRRERIAGYQIAFTSPQARPIHCNVAIYRSGAAARKVYRLRGQSVSGFVADLGGRPLPVAEIGEETHAHRFGIGPARYLGLAWRFRRVLSTCVGSGSTRSRMAEILVVARAQQARIAWALGGGRR